MKNDQPRAAPGPRAVPPLGVLRRWVAWPLASAVGATLFFLVAFLVIGGGLSLVVDDVDAVMAGKGAFTVALTVAFAAAGAGLGLAQWLVMRRQVRALAWIGGWSAGLGLVGLLFGLGEWAMGDEATWSVAFRATHEIVHSAAGGALVGFLTWRFAMAPLGVPGRTWVLALTAGFPLAGLAIWALASAAHIVAGDAKPLGMLLLGLVSAWAWGRSTAHAVPVAAAPPEAILPASLGPRRAPR